MAFWRRKKDEFVSLGLGRAADDRIAESSVETETQPTPATVTPVESTESSSRAPWQTSVLGLDLSIEQLQAQEAALEQEFSARFRRAVASTRESLSEKIDAVFAGAKQIDAVAVLALGRGGGNGLARTGIPNLRGAEMLVQSQVGPVAPPPEQNLAVGQQV